MRGLVAGLRNELVKMVGDDGVRALAQMGITTTWDSATKSGGTLKIDDANRATAAGVYTQYKQPFLDTISGATSKELLVRDEDVQVLHGFDTVENATSYLTSELFTNDVVAGLSPLLRADPEIRIYQVA